MFIPRCGPVLWNIPIGSVTVTQPGLSRTVVLVLKFLVFLARWNNLGVVDFADGHEIFYCVVLKLGLRIVGKIRFSPGESNTVEYAGKDYTSGYFH